MAYHQCVKTRDRATQYCSSYKVKNHEEGKLWVKALLAHLGNPPATDFLKPTESDSIPDGAVTYP